jgi:methylase of polypeptide subunit release factors
MTSYIDPPPSLEFDPPAFDTSDSTSTRGVSIVELGSGSGLVASTIAKLLDPMRDHLIATDLPDVSPQCRVSNIIIHRQLLTLYDS